jgi:hypothetical protein
MTVQFSIENEIKKPLDFNNLCSICGCSEGNKHTLPCNHFFHYNCLLKYLQSESKNKNNSNMCPYCRQSFGYLPLESGMKPIKNIHLEYKMKNGKTNNISHDLCAGYYLSGINKGTKCLNHCIKDSKYCRFHKNTDTQSNTSISI